MSMEVFEPGMRICQRVPGGELLHDALRNYVVRDCGLSGTVRTFAARRVLLRTDVRQTNCFPRCSSMAP